MGRALDLESNDPGLNSGFWGKVLCNTAHLSQDESSSTRLLGVMPRIVWSESNFEDYTSHMKFEMQKSQD